MSYIINKFRGEQLIVLEDGTVDTSTSINLVGRNYVGYGESQNENFVWLLENFANAAPPPRPLIGQIWFNTTDNAAYAYDGINWNPIGTAVVNSTAPINPNAGALWVDSDSDQLYIWNGSNWAFIGPEAVAGFNSTRARSTSLDDSYGNPKPVIILETDGVPFAICTSESFVIHPNFSISGFSNSLQVGINLSSTAKINGNITGNSGSTDRLLTPRYINNVAFDGQSDITIKSSTTNKLLKGTYITGSDFDGSEQITWSVDATPSNSIGKVVARNSEGGFSAGTISATFVGELTGNVTATSGTSRFNIVEATTFVGATLTGNANSATQLATPRKINDVSFNGTRDITITADAGTLTGTTINSTVVESSLQTVGTLRELTVADTGISVGSGSQLRLLVDSGTPTLRSQIGKLNFDMGSSGPDISFVDSATSLTLGGPSAPAILGDNTTNLGITGYKFNNVYANNFKGNADTATAATTSTHLAGGGAGAIPYQTAANTTAMLGLGTTGYVLKAQSNGIGWEALASEQLNKGSYINMVNTTTSGSVNYYSSLVPVTISVDASSSNTASKVVARDASGNFSAGTITATLSGNSTGTHTGNVSSASSIGMLAGGRIRWPDDAYGGSGDTAWIDVYNRGGEKTTLRLHLDNDAAGSNEDTIELDAAGGVLVSQGNVYSSAAPTDNYHLTNKYYVDQKINSEIAASRLRSMVITSGAAGWSTTTPDSQFAYLINAYMPASSVAVGTQFNLIVNISYATTSNTVSGSQWINAYKWGSLSISSTTNLYNSYLGRKLVYQSNGTSWTYTGTWSYV